MSGSSEAKMHAAMAKTDSQKHMEQATSDVEVRLPRLATPTTKMMVSSQRNVSIMKASIVFVMVVLQGICGSLIRMVDAQQSLVTPDIEELLHEPVEVASIIEEYLEAEETRLAKLRQFASDYSSKDDANLEPETTGVHNPINAFKMVQRLVNVWEDVESLMQAIPSTGFMERIETKINSANSGRIPREGDLNNVITALFRVQDVYKLEPEAIANGHLFGKIGQAKLFSAADCYSLGLTAYKTNDHYHSLLWLQEALRRVTTESSQTVSEVAILDHLSVSMFYQGNVEHAYNMTMRLMEIDPEDAQRHEENLQFYHKELQKNRRKTAENMATTAANPKLKTVRDVDSGIPERELYEALCRGEVMLPAKNLSKLYCYYKNDHPFLTIGPFKVEIMHFKPRILLFKDVVSDNEANEIIRQGKPRLNLATVRNDDGSYVPSKVRTAESAWLEASRYPIIARVDKRTELMTGLTANTAEHLQLATYQLGGHYDVHHDYAINPGNPKYAFSNLPWGNRLATVLFYLTQPVEGGATVFPSLKVSLFPTKNDAVFWYNLYPNGFGDTTTKHAACPVVAGVKWVANKWIHEYEQEFRRPCGLDKWAYE